MTPLNRAVTLAQADYVSVLVGQHLELDVTGTLDEFLHVEVAIAEGRGRLRARGIELVRQVPRPSG